MTKRKTPTKPQKFFDSVLPAQVDPEPFLNHTKPQPSRALIESALYQIEFGLAETAMLFKSIVGGQQYDALLRWGYQLVNRAMSPGKINTALHSLALTAVAVGWVAGESGVQSALLNHLVSEPAKPGSKAGEQCDVTGEFCTR